MQELTKKYNTIGELLVEYRKLNKMSQADFSGLFNVDVRTVQRWENGTTLIKPDKEESIVKETLLPYQLVRNLNGPKPIPTYYDFHIRKYSFNQLNNKLPSANWFKAHLDEVTKRIRPMDYEQDIRNLEKYMKFHKKINKSLKEVIRESIRLLPEMNLIITDDSGYYSGHSLIFPLRPEAYLQLRNREKNEDELGVYDLISPDKLDRPIFHGFDITADCNDNIYYISSELLRFIRDRINQDYIFTSIAFRYDNFELNKEIGLTIIWEDEIKTNEYGLQISRRFQEGNFNNFLS